MAQTFQLIYNSCLFRTDLIFVVQMLQIATTAGAVVLALGFNSLGRSFDNLGAAGFVVTTVLSVYFVLNTFPWQGPIDKYGLPINLGYSSAFMAQAFNLQYIGVDHLL